MSYLKSIICAVLLVAAMSSAAMAGNIPAVRSTASRTGNIPAASRTGNIPVSATDASRNTSGRFGFSENISRLIQLLLESGALF